jgi:hypothetical protein
MSAVLRDSCRTSRDILGADRTTELQCTSYKTLDGQTQGEMVLRASLNHWQYSSRKNSSVKDQAYSAMTNPRRMNLSAPFLVTYRTSIARLHIKFDDLEAWVRR